MDNQFDPSRQDPQQQQWQQQQWQQQQQQGHYDQNGQWHPNPQYPGPVEIGFADAIRICFNKYADFKGRAPRAEYWWWVLFTFVVSMATGWIPSSYPAWPFRGAASTTSARAAHGASCP